jgi:homoserine trans-succinylase
MHLLESFALNTGLKIGTPYLYTSFVPRGFDGEYITLQPYGKAPARNYAYWQEVIDILKPIFTEANINSFWAILE